MSQISPHPHLLPALSLLIVALFCAYPPSHFSPAAAGDLALPCGIRLFLVDWTVDPGAATSPAARKHLFVVLGSTGNVYRVQMSCSPGCDCPDANKGRVCKHIYFVMCKVLKVDHTTSHIPFQRHLLPTELEQILPTEAPRLAAGLLASETVQLAVRVAVARPGGSGGQQVGHCAESLRSLLAGGVRTVCRRELEPGEGCAICFDPLVATLSTGAPLPGPVEPLDWCRGSCGYSYHSACLHRWFELKAADVKTCPRCRQPWVQLVPPAPGAAGGGGGEVAAAGPAGVLDPPFGLSLREDGYVNLGSVSGLRARRDTSTYSEWYGVHQRRNAAAAAALEL